MSASMREARRAAWRPRAVVPLLAMLGVVLAIAAAGACVFAPAAGANSELTVSPLIIDDLAAEPGDTLRETVTVSATGDEPITVEFQHADFGFSEDSYQVDIISDAAPDTTDFSTRGWFSVARDRYTIKAGGSLAIPVTIEVPENSTPGVHLGAAFFRTVVDSKRGGSQVLTSAQAGPLLFITIKGGSRPKPKLARFRVPGIVKEGPIRAKLEVENRGDTFFTYEGTVELRRNGKHWKAKIPLKYVVPGQPRDVRDEDGDALVFGKRGLPFGRYTVETRLKVEPTGTRIIAERTVWVVPGWMRGVGVVLIGLLVAAMGWIGWWVSDRIQLRRAIAAGLLNDVHHTGEDDDDHHADDGDTTSAPEVDIERHLGSDADAHAVDLDDQDH